MKKRIIFTIGVITIFVLILTSNKISYEKVISLHNWMSEQTIIITTTNYQKENAFQYKINDSNKEEIINFMIEYGITTIYIDNNITFKEIKTFKEKIKNLKLINISSILE